MKKIGRPVILTPTKQAEILAILSTGCGRRTAAEYVGCDVKTIYNTADRDPDFDERLTRTEIAVELRHLGNLSRAATENRFWRASAWSLERMLPEKYSLRRPDAVSPQQMSDLIGRVAELILEEVPVPKYRKRIIARLKRVVIDDSEFDATRRMSPSLLEEETVPEPLRVTLASNPRPAIDNG